ncbi:MAG: DUF4430 domain-containing protein [Patescibacteria group bacterium UBA2163]
MKKKQKTLLRNITLAFAVALLGIWLFAGWIELPRDTEQQEITTEQQTISISIEGMYQDESIRVKGDATILDVLLTLDKENDQLKVTTETYDGLGTLVTQIGDKKNGDRKRYWQYTVNGIMPQIGADALIVTEGDHIQWEFKLSEF